MADSKYDQVADLLLSKKELLSCTEEDAKLILKLWGNYWKKRKGNLRSSSDVLAAAVLWQYSGDNYLWEKDKKWTQASLAELFNVRPKTVGENSRQIRRLLKIECFDDRYCRKEVAESNPFNEMAILPSGFIVPKDIAIEKNMQFAPLKKDKNDYYYDGMDWLDEGNEDKAKQCFKKAIEIDDEFVDSYNGLGTVYWHKNLNKAREYFKKAYELTRKNFSDEWPERIEWGILENRQFLRSIQYYGLALWREGNFEEAKELFLLLLKLNPNDNQGARYLVASIYAGLSWEESDEYEDDRDKEEQLLEEQNKKHGFWSWEEEDE